MAVSLLSLSHFRLADLQDARSSFRRILTTEAPEKRKEAEAPAPLTRCTFTGDAHHADAASTLSDVIAVGLRHPSVLGPRCWPLLRRRQGWPSWHGALTTSQHASYAAPTGICICPPCPLIGATPSRPFWVRREQQTPHPRRAVANVDGHTQCIWRAQERGAGPPLPAGQGGRALSNRAVFDGGRRAEGLWEAGAAPSRLPRHTARGPHTTTVLCTPRRCAALSKNSTVKQRLHTAW